MRAPRGFRLRSRLAAERGAALAVAVGVMALVTVLGGIAVTRSVGLSHTSDYDRDSKRALAAAEAGLAQATFRINRLAPTNALCVTDVVVAQLPGLGCPLRTEGMGDGARYTYQVSPVLALADECAGLPVQTDAQGQVTIVQRCVTSVGEVNGQKRRAQARVAAFQGNPIFPLAGIVGVEGVQLKNTATVEGWIGSNGLIEMNNSSTISGLELGPGAPQPSVGTSTVGQVRRRSNEQGGFVFSPVEVGDSATVNDDARITNGLASPAVAPWDASSGVSYNASARTLTMGNGSSLTLGGGTYNFCELSMGNNARIMIAPRPSGAPQGVRIFIDSPYREGSSCSGAGDGTLTMGQNATFGNPPGGDPRNLQIYVYGWSSAESSHSSVVEFNNSAFSGAIYAPQSHVVFKNSATIGGAIAGRTVEFKNSLLFRWADGAGEIRARTLTLFQRTAWKECPSEPPEPADPEAGC